VGKVPPRWVTGLKSRNRALTSDRIRTGIGICQIASMGTSVPVAKGAEGA